MNWQQVDVAPGLGGYADWELAEAVTNPRNSPDLWVPVFVQLAWDGITASVLREIVAQIEALLAAPDAAYLMQDHERDYLATEVERETGLPREIRTVVFSRQGGVGHPLWTVLEVGSPVELEKPDAPAPAAMPYRISAGIISELPLVAVIDDGIGFLNRRFRAAPQQSRFEAVWIQTTKPVPVVPGDGLGTVVFPGRALERADIEGWMALTPERTEADCLRAMNERLFGVAGHRSTDRRMAHGTAVLDVAAGAAVGDPMAAVRLLAVQVPAAAVGETSGRRLDGFVWLGLRWVIARALRVAQKTGERVPLIVNLSLGSLAGPKDGTGIMERAVAYEVERFRALSGDTPIRVVVAYGNARRARLVARADIAGEQAQVIPWQIQMDDATASFMELRVPKGAAARLMIEPPGGFAALLPVPFPLPGTGWLLPGNTGAVARLSVLPEANYDTALIVVAPTVRDDARPLAPAGVWRVTVQNAGGAVLPLLVKVRRDDTPDGYRRTGRQSWIEAADGWEWEDESGGWTAPAPACLVTRAGTGVALAGMTHPSVYMVAAAEPVAAGLRGTRYSAEGDGTGPMPGPMTGPEYPTVAALGDEGRMLRGRLAAGVLSGSAVRVSGTSVAAPLVVREMVRLARSALRLPAQAPGNPRDPVELAALLGQPVLIAPPEVLRKRTGSGVLKEYP